MEQWSILNNIRGTFLVYGLDSDDEINIYSVDGSLPESFVSVFDGKVETNPDEEIFNTFESKESFFEYYDEDDVQNVEEILNDTDIGCGRFDDYSEEENEEGESIWVENHVELGNFKLIARIYEYNRGHRFPDYRIENID